MITVVSTGFNAPTKQRCLDSVRMQTVHAEHVYVEASEQTPPRTVTQNLYEAVLDLPRNTIVVHLDGDDELADNHVIDRVCEMYESGADMTYGSFKFSDGRVPAMRAYTNPKNCRREPWLASHLKTFRAGFLHRVPAIELQYRGDWIDMACDHAVMFPLLELARNPVFCPEVLAIYHFECAWEHRFAAKDRAREAEIVRDLRSRVPIHLR
jgi:hypothetical protein